MKRKGLERIFSFLMAQHKKRVSHPVSEIKLGAESKASKKKQCQRTVFDNWHSLMIAFGIVPHRIVQISAECFLFLFPPEENIYFPVVGEVFFLRIHRLLLYICLN